jgi:L-lactate dehydrogenase complex protein LldF
MYFKRKAAEELADQQLQLNLQRVRPKFVGKRAAAIREIEFEKMRAVAAEIRDRVLNDLDVYLEQFEKTAVANGATVHWAETPEDVNRIVCDIAKLNRVEKVIKSKSMVSEESALNHALESIDVKVVETDLGEYVAQLAKEPPFHIIAPVLQKSKEEVSALFEKHHRSAPKKSIPELCREAREVLRPHFLTADMGISGGNFLIAETGSVMIVTNEGNGRMTTTMPKIHVAITGIEKIVPTLEDVSVLLRLLPRSATGQSISNYVSMLTGAKNKNEVDGPEQMHFILVDSGRSKLVGTDLQEALRCIRCGACMNHCPVYQNVGGHAYGWVYPGPIGSVLTPMYVGLENAPDLPNASTFCNQCGVVCPVKIPLPDLLRKLREKQMQRKLRSPYERIALRVWSWFSSHPAAYAISSAIGVRLLKMMGGRKKFLRYLPFGSGWTKGRDMPAPQGKTFRELYKESKNRS